MIWQYMVKPTGVSFGIVAINMLILSVIGVLVGIALIKLPQEFTQGFFLGRRTKSKLGSDPIGDEEYKLRAEIQIKIGVGIILWCLALALSLLLRLLGTTGLGTRFLPAIVLLALPIVISCFIIYCLFFFPSFLKASRLIDKRKSYMPTKKEKKSKNSTSNDIIHINIIPIKALSLSFAVAFGYYIFMIAISVPAGLPAQNHDHLLHQLGMSVMSMLGYILGLSMSLGDDFRPLLPWLRPYQEKK